MKKVYIILLLLFAGLTGLYSQTASQNYILTSAYTNDAGTTLLDQIQYFDGLGRPMQTVQKGITPAKADLITYQEYDRFGRDSATWLPAIASGNNGAYMTLDNFKVKSTATYNNTTYNAAADVKPYSYPAYEASPLNRVLQQFGAGADWQNNGKSVKTEYLTNSGTTGALSCALFTVSGTGVSTKVVRNNFYGDAQLFVTKTTDEDGNISYQFKDKLDHVVLTRQILKVANADTYVDTYYVYDDFGNLCFVVPPILADLNVNGTYDETTAQVKQYAYIYRYDARNRCIFKKLPGCEPIYYVYDGADRLIFTQDGENRNKGEWQFSIPDALGRVVLTGTCKDTISVSNKLVKGLFSIAGVYKFYVIQVDGLNKSLVNPSILSENIYDGYDFLGYNGVPNDVNTQYNTETGYDACYGDHQAANKWKCKGLLTGTLTAQMNPDGTVSSTYLYSVMYYDYRGRLVQSKGNNPLAGGLEKEYIAYNFTGQPTGKKHIHSATGKTTQTEVYAYTYDHAGRLTKETHQLNGGTIVNLAENTYDELGRLKTNKKGGQASLNTTYGYNIRSWIKSIDNSFFSESLIYNDGVNKIYNGNISEMDWKQSSDISPRIYKFSYDNLSRLTAANYQEGSQANGNYRTAYTYDKQGNILTLQRYGMVSADQYNSYLTMIDNLTFSYTGMGNQLLKVEDTAPNIPYASSADFKNYSNVATEYTYNANGAMTKDLNKGISDIQYNSLNLPGIMDIKSPVAEARNECTYSATGQKLKLVQKWNPNYSTTPVAGVGSAINTGLLTQSKTTEYIGNMIYENGALKRILVDGGYIEGAYRYFLTDHQGNNRVVATQTSSAGFSAVQKNHYYPFGMPFPETPVAEQGFQPYKYNGKELDMLSGLNLYDYSARYYEPALGRFTTMDPLCEKYYSISPYAYCMNNPIRYKDLDGRDGMVTGSGTKEDPYIITANYYYQNGSLNNDQIKGLNAAVDTYNKSGGKNGVEVKNADGSTSYVKYNLSAQGVENVDEARKGTAFETTTGETMYYGNVVNTNPSGSGNEYGSANNFTVSFNVDNINAGVSDGMNSSSLNKGVAIHEIGHNLGGEHSDGTSVMDVITKTITTSQIGGTATTTYSYPSTSNKFTGIIFNRRDIPRPTPVVDASGITHFSGAGRIWTRK